MNYDFDQIINRKNTNSIKWDSGEFLKAYGITERFDDNTIPLFVADMDFPVAQPIFEALMKVVDNRIYGYTLPMNDYYESIHNWFKRKYDWHIEHQEIIYVPGTVAALNISVETFTNEGDGVIVQRPIYPPFIAAIEDRKRKVVNNSLINNNGHYQIDFEDFEIKAKNVNNRLFLLCNPHNPTGRIFSDEDLRRLSEICHKYNVIICADEIHGDIIRSDKTFTPIVKCSDNTDHIVTCTAVNKTFNLAGLHASNVIIANETIRNSFIARQGIQLPTPFTVEAVKAAYNDGEEWLLQVNDYIDENIQFSHDFLKERMPKVKMNIPEATYMVWLDFREYGISAQEVRNRIYNTANVVFETGRLFGKEGEGFERVCVPSPRPMIKEALERVAKAFEDLN